MSTPVVVIIALSLLAISSLTAALQLVHRRRVRRGSLEDPADRYQREMREIQRITRARSARRYTRQVGDPPAGDYGTGSGA
jgi:hypothetical protein